MKMAVGVAGHFVIITLGGELGEAIKTNAETYGVAENLTEVQILPWTVTEFLQILQPMKRPLRWPANKPLPRMASAL